MKECAPGARFDLRGVTVRYGSTTALSDVDLGVGPGEAVALVGPSGAGKSTLLGLLNGAVRPTSGRVEVKGRSLAELSSAELACTRACIGVIYQDLRLVPNLRVAQNVLAGRAGRLALPRSLVQFYFPSRRLLAEVHALLERVGIADKLFERTDRLSGGQRQRVAVARALFQQPVALLADEPVSSVDPARAEDTLRLLVEVSRERNLTLLVSLHDQRLARALFPRLVGLRRGRITFDRPAAEVSDGEIAALYDLAPEELLADAG